MIWVILFVLLQNDEIEQMQKKLNMQGRALGLAKHEYLALTKDSSFTAFSGGNTPGRCTLVTKLGDLSKTARKLCKYRDHEINSKLFPSLNNVSHDLHVFYKLGGNQNFAYCLESEDIAPFPPFIIQKDRASSLVSKIHGVLDICGTTISNAVDQEWQALKTINYLAVELCDDDDEEKKEEFDSSKDNDDIKIEEDDKKYSFTWKPLTQMTTARYFPGICEFANHKLFVAGGDTTKGFTDIVEIFDYKTKEWVLAKEMKNPRRSCGSCYWKEREEIVIGGGYDKTYSKKVARYDINKNKWMNVPSDTNLGHAGGPNVKIRYDYCNNGLITIGGILSGSWQDYIEFIDIRDNKARWIPLCDIAVKVGYKKETLNFMHRPLHSLFDI